MINYKSRWRKIRRCHGTPFAMPPAGIPMCWASQFFIASPVWFTETSFHHEVLWAYWPLMASIFSSSNLPSWDLGRYIAYCSTPLVTRWVSLITSSPSFIIFQIICALLLMIGTCFQNKRCSFTITHLLL